MNRNEFLNEVKHDAGIGGLSPLMDGKSKMPITDVIGETLTISMVGIVDYTDGEDNHTRYGIVITKEYPDKYINGGKALTAVCDSIIDRALKATGGDVEAANALITEMSLKFRPTRVTTKGKKTFTKIELM